MCAFCWLCPCLYYCKIMQLCCVCSEESETVSSCSGDVKIFCGFLSRFSHDRALNTISHGMQKYPVDDYFKVPLASCWQSAKRNQIFAAITKICVVFLQLLTKLVQPEHLFKNKTSVVCCKIRQHVKSKSWEGDTSQSQRFILPY